MCSRIHLSARVPRSANFQRIEHEEKKEVDRVVSLLAPAPEPMDYLRRVHRFALV